MIGFLTVMLHGDMYLTWSLSAWGQGDREMWFKMCLWKSTFLLSEIKTSANPVWRGYCSLWQWVMGERGMQGWQISAMPGCEKTSYYSVNSFLDHSGQLQIFLFDRLKHVGVFMRVFSSKLFSNIFFICLVLFGGGFFGFLVFFLFFVKSNIVNILKIVQKPTDSQSSGPKRASLDNC